MKQIPFTKMQAQGNDFVVLNGLNAELPELTEDFVRTITERRYGNFRRVIDLPADVDPEKVTTDFDSGVLTIHLMKVHPSDAKRVKVTKG